MKQRLVSKSFEGTIQSGIMLTKPTGFLSLGIHSQLPIGIQHNLEINY